MAFVVCLMVILCSVYLSVFALIVRNIQCKKYLFFCGATSLD